MFKIGEFSRFTRVSVKMLRHYDQIGLLRPAHIAPASNYRYYSADQLPRLNRIIALKDLGFSLYEIIRLVDDKSQDAEIDGMFHARKAEIEQKIREERHRLRDLESQIRMMSASHDRFGVDIIPRAVPGQWIASIRTVLGNNSSFAPWFDKIESYVAGRQVRARRSPFTIYHDAEYDQQESEVELAVPIEDRIPAHEQIEIRELPAEPTMACMTFLGGYAQRAELLNSLLVWIERHQYEISGPLREVYHRFNANELEHLALPDSFLTEQENEFVTELQLPIRLNSRPIDIKI